MSGAHTIFACATCGRQVAGCLPSCPGYPDALVEEVACCATCPKAENPAPRVAHALVAES